MDEETTQEPTAGEASEGPAACGPCRGTGRLTSNLGGVPHGVDCPWCEGTGRFIPAHDAQQAARGGERSRAD